MENIGLPNTNNFAYIVQPKDTASSSTVALQKVQELSKTSKNDLEQDQDKARFEAVKKAAQKILKVLPFSALNARFTIYRDTTSENLTYVTRFTNIDTGEVKIIREPDLLTFGNPNNGLVLDRLL